MKATTDQSVVLFQLFDEYITLYRELFVVEALTAMYQMSRHVLFGSLPSVDDIPEALGRLMSLIREEAFEPEELRKALVATTLKAYRADKIANSEMTPDSISLLVGYVVSKYFEGHRDFSLCDPVVGTASMLTAVANLVHHQGDIVAFDANLDQIQTARVFTDLLGYEVDYVLEDCLKSNVKGFDCIIADVPVYLYDDDYFPHRFIAHWVSKIEPGGVMVAVIPNDFFEVESVHKDEILQQASLAGLIQLPADMFVDRKLQKSILLVEPGERKVDDFLLVELPRLEDKDAFQQAIQRMETWFKKEKAQ
jgi:site-specific DNA-methyltransferase (adenine-specific)